MNHDNLVNLHGAKKEQLQRNGSNAKGGIFGIYRHFFG